MAVVFSTIVAEFGEFGPFYSFKLIWASGTIRQLLSSVYLLANLQGPLELTENLLNKPSMGVISTPVINFGH